MVPVKERIKTAQRVQSASGYSLQVFRRGVCGGVSVIVRGVTGTFFLS